MFGSFLLTVLNWLNHPDRVWMTSKILTAFGLAQIFRQHLSGSIIQAAFGCPNNLQHSDWLNYSDSIQVAQSS
jgi:hypothetical protein